MPLLFYVWGTDALKHRADPAAAFLKARGADARLVSRVEPDLEEYTILEPSVKVNVLLATKCSGQYVNFYYSTRFPITAGLTLHALLYYTQAAAPKVLLAHLTLSRLLMRGRDPILVAQVLRHGGAVLQGGGRYPFLCGQAAR